MQFFALFTFIGETFRSEIDAFIAFESVLNSTGAFGGVTIDITLGDVFRAARLLLLMIRCVHLLFACQFETDTNILTIYLRMTEKRVYTATHRVNLLFRYINDDW